MEKLNYGHSKYIIFNIYLLYIFNKTFFIKYLINYIIMEYEYLSVHLKSLRFVVIYLSS